MTFLKLATCALLLLPVAAHADIASPQPHVSVPQPRKPAPVKPQVRPLPQSQPVPANNDNPRDPVSVSRKTPAIAARLAKVRGGQFDPANDQSQSQIDERITQVQLDGQCGFAGCSSTTLVVFTYQTRGANTATSSVMALVSCPPIMRQGCTAVPAEVKPQGSLEQTR